MMTFKLMIFQLMTEPMKSMAEPMVHGSWFGVGDGTIVVWSLVGVIVPVGLASIVALIWAGKTGHFKNIQEIADRQLDIED
ncbi:MAG: hypothetical protein NT070_10345 [Cyanobacteria bacterium]|nr:hypothetical protein [Cyanobacteriota bacterium]